MKSSAAWSQHVKSLAFSEVFPIKPTFFKDGISRKMCDPEKRLLRVLYIFLWWSQLLYCWHWIERLQPPIKLFLLTFCALCHFPSLFLPYTVFRKNKHSQKGKHFPGNQTKFFFDRKVFSVDWKVFSVDQLS